MATGLPLFDLAPSARGSATSHAQANSRAALQSIVDQLPARRRQVYDCIAEHGPLSDEQGIELTGQVQGYRARRGELARDRLIECAGQGENRLGSSVDLWRVRGRAAQ